MAEKLFVELDAFYLVGFPDMDQQHRRLAHLLNELHASVEDPGESAEYRARLFDEMIDYVRFHFKNEERMMRAQIYPGFGAHADLHGRLLEELARLRDAFVEGSEEEVLIALKEWLLVHIEKSDKPLGAFLGAAGTRSLGQLS